MLLSRRWPGFDDRSPERKSTSFILRNPYKHFHCNICIPFILQLPFIIQFIPLKKIHILPKYEVASMQAESNYNNYYSLSIWRALSLPYPLIAVPKMAWGLSCLSWHTTGVSITWALVLSHDWCDMILRNS